MDADSLTIQREPARPRRSGGSRSANDFDPIDAQRIAGALVDDWRWLVGVTALVLAAAGLYAFTAVPIFRSDVLLRVEASDATFPGFQGLSDALASDVSVEAEIAIIRSRSVLGDAVSALRLHTRARPVHFPLIGAGAARRWERESAGIAEPLFGLSSYAWGGERVVVDSLTVPERLEGSVLTLVAGGRDGYVLLGPEGETILRGQVGQVAESEAKDVSLAVSELVGGSGVRFELVRTSTLATVGDLRRRLSVRERGRRTGVIEISLEGEEPERVATSLDRIADAYQRQDIAQKSAQARTSLKFVTEHLPALQARLHDAEAQLAEHRQASGSLDLTLQSGALLERMAEIETALSDLKMKQLEIGERFTHRHPVMATMRKQRQELERLRSEIESETHGLPRSEQESLRLMRDVQVANALYESLLARSQELEVLEAGTLGDVRMVDAAFVPRSAVKPRKSLILALALTLGGFLALSVVALRYLMDARIHDPGQLENSLAIPVLASVPHSRVEQNSRRFRGAAARAQGLLVDRSPYDASAESLRSLRTGLEFWLNDAERRVVSVGGSAPGVGKTFISANLAGVMSRGGQRVLLVDGDLRRGRLHETMQVPSAPGFSELLLGSAEVGTALHETAHSNLVLLPAGSPNPDPGALLTTRRFERVLSSLVDDFDVIIVDTAPVLAASESIAVARVAAINLVVVRADAQRLAEIEAATRLLERGGASVHGFVLNAVRTGSRRAAYYGYEYRPAGAEL